MTKRNLYAFVLLLRPSIIMVFLFMHFLSSSNAQRLSFENIKDFTVDYGVIEKGSPGIFELVVKNTDNIPLIITNIKSSCGCTVTSWPKEPLIKGKKYTISIKYDTNQVGPIAKTITIQSNDKKSVYRVIRIRGLVKDNEATD